MIPFPFNENQFSFFFFFFFFVADHLLVGQLCTNSKSDRSLLSCLKVTQCSTSEIGDAPLYNPCSLPIQVITTGPLPAPSKCKSGLSRITGMCQGWWKQNFRPRLWSLVWFQVRATSCHLTSLRSVWNSTTKCTWMCWRVCDPLVQSGGRWQTLGVGSRTRAPAHKSKETQAWLQKECYDFVPFSHWPPPPPTWTRWTTSFGHTSREHHQHDLPQHQSQPDHRHPPSIRRAPAGACEKGMLPIPYPYWGGDWGWRRLHWIDVSSTTVTWIDFFNKSFKIKL